MRRKDLLAAVLIALPATACAPIAGEPGMGDKPTAVCPETRGWTAWINAMPGPGAVPTLIVTGEVNVPQDMDWTFKPGPLDRMMPPTQRFTLVSTAGEGSPSGWQGVRAEIRPAQREYGAIVIGCEGREIARIEEVETAY